MNETWTRKLAQIRVALGVPLFLLTFTFVMILTVPLFVGLSSQGWALRPIFPGAVILTAQLFPVLFEELARLIAITAAGLFGRVRAAAIAGLLLGLLEKSFHIAALFKESLDAVSVVEIALPTMLHATLTAMVAKCGRNHGRSALGGVFFAVFLLHLFNNALLNWSARQIGAAPLHLGVFFAGLLIGILAILMVKSQPKLSIV